MAAKPKPQHNIVMFRLEPPRVEMLSEIIRRDPIVGVHSGHQLARKIVVDYLEGRLQYTHDKYKKADPDLLDAETVEAAR